MTFLKEHHRELGPDRIAALKERIALNTPDPRAAALYVDIDGDDWAHIYPPVEAAAPISTGQAIDTFLETYGRTSQKEEALLEKLIFNPTPDYAQILEKEEAGSAAAESATAPRDSQDTLIDAFIAGQKDNAMPHTAPPAATTASAQQPERKAQTESTPQADSRRSRAPLASGASSSLSESLAAIYIKQGRYERAFEIISALNLKNPEKSIYFADQLRFLQKLITLQKRRDAAAASPRPAE